MMIVAALLLVGSHALFAEVVVWTDQDTYETRTNEPIWVGHHLVNPTADTIEMWYNDLVLTYNVRRINQGNPALGTNFKVKLNGETHSLRYITVRIDSNFYGGSIVQPLDTATVGGTVGTGSPFNILQGYSALDTRLITEDSGEIELQDGEKIQLLTPGLYKISVILDNIEINNVVGLVANHKYFTVKKVRDRSEQVSFNGG
ncbi:MAG: hypothetical protein COV74_06675 [Candidatus Omnitrophica bacterium CG11_big_fil_rev_8_21_14_0_20_45_26]|uniref:Uncharacterized protein n=1 Tax=Candidatus Abzuiibacterium crystallinum TaxID=1974748 RepID=A0A2H0LND9_9BACT|nr:MAG: hypothetical protein COV74_06675 [Candidatus Omnitrophica bacterium CG11_big_fil_rev_8_21_14_0_20_45_26]PIW64772.1 MAG: hypothetical protein COW12_04855 [Candidatus Omnitrophica bacterium CG12_big_fil_rev_8_21_14_0_65_45_16]